MGESSIYKLSRQVKRKENSLYNALRSIYEDAGFVMEMHGLRPRLPLLANLRCGLWYARKFDDVCYFKSTDGHTGNWAFSSTRLNMHVALQAARAGGCTIVDATRKGKRFPDSMSKTIPIWACVLNRGVARIREMKVTTTSSCSSSSTAWDTSLHLPSWVSDSEKSSIELLLDGWVDALIETGADLEGLAATLSKPLRALWISQQSLIWMDEVPEASSLSFTPLVLVSASRPVTTPERVSDAEFSWVYIPGAADDEESWAKGLTPAVFWRHAEDVIRTGPEECNKKVGVLVDRDKAYRSLHNGELRPGIELETKYHTIGDSGLLLGKAQNDSETCALLKQVGAVIDCQGRLEEVCKVKGESYLQLQIKDCKMNRLSLQHNLPRIIDFARKQLSDGKSIYVCCESGEDISCCVCLAVLLCCFDPQGRFDNGTSFVSSPREITKSEVRNRLVYLCSFATSAHSSRGMLKQVYNFARSHQQEQKNR